MADGSEKGEYGMEDVYHDQAVPTFRDCRLDEAGDYEPEPSIDISTEQITRRIEAVHCRLLEGATAGRLTWNGDQIVRTSPAKLSSLARSSPQRKDVALNRMPDSSCPGARPPSQPAVGLARPSGCPDHSSSVIESGNAVR